MALADISKLFFLKLAENKTAFKIASANPMAQQITKRFVAGLELPEAIEAVKELNNHQIIATLDLLGESVANPQEAQKAGDDYVEVLKMIHQTGVKSNASLKLTQMGLDISRELCLDVMRKILTTAQQLGIFVRIDMEGSALTTITIDIFKTLLAEFGTETVGIVLQAYLYRTEADIDALIPLRARMRLCKGAYREPAEVAFPEKRDVDKNYLKLAQKLMQEANYPALATHDEGMIQSLVQFAATQNISSDRFEFQMLYGVRRDLQEQLVKQNQTVRVYVPYGGQWYPYFMRRLAERPANVMFILKNSLK
jgi:proline dehydrogenase